MGAFVGAGRRSLALFERSELGATAERQRRQPTVPLLESTQASDGLVLMATASLHGRTPEPIDYPDRCTINYRARSQSVALVRTEDYWRGTPGERSVRFNTLLVDYGFYVHRILIVDDFLWPPGATLPSKQLYTWMLAQFSKGIQIGLVRCSELVSEMDLLIDFGIYGDTAVGYQLTDELGQTVRYEMLFGAPQLQIAEDRWKRLSLYTHPLESI